MIRSVRPGFSGALLLLGCCSAFAAQPVPRAAFGKEVDAAAADAAAHIKPDGA